MRWRRWRDTSQRKRGFTPPGRGGDKLHFLHISLYLFDCCSSHGEKLGSGLDQHHT